MRQTSVQLCKNQWCEASSSTSEPLPRAFAKVTALVFRVFGEFNARDGAGRLVTLGSKKNRALLAALVLAPSGALPRARIARLPLELPRG